MHVTLDVCDVSRRSVNVPDLQRVITIPELPVAKPINQQELKFLVK